jgi:transposase-like protein
MVTIRNKLLQYLGALGLAVVLALTAADTAELREAKKRIRLLEQENEVLRRAAAYLSQANLPGK